MLERIGTYINQHELLSESASVLVAVSGGADSMALLDILMRLGYDCQVAHCNFQLRGAESDQDEAFVKQRCEELGVPYHVKRMKVTGSVQTEARRMRYSWFEEIRETLSLEAIAVAHHMDDQAETFILNALRGTGTGGLSGMKPKNGFIIRPMLGVSRQQIMDHMKKHGLDHREDSSNASSDYRRNVIRQDVMTALKRIDGDAAVRITETMSRVHADEQLIKEYLRSLDVVQDTGDQIRIDINKLAATQDPDAFLFHILSPYGYTGELISQIAASMKSQSGKRFEVSGYVLIRDRDEFILETESTPMPEKVIEAGISEVREPIGLKLEHLDTFSVSADDRIGQFDFDQIRFPLTIRRWKEGDRFTPLGMEGTKKLSDFFVDEKMSLLDKQSAWVLESEGEIIWVMGHRISEKVKITSETTSVLQITMHG